MKTFARFRTVSELRLLCRDLGIRFDDTQHRLEGRDTVVIGGPICRDKEGASWVIFNVYNGSFFGRTPAGVEFSSSSDEHEDEDWFQKLLEFFYVEKGQPGGREPPTSMVAYTLGGTALLQGANL